MRSNYTRLALVLVIMALPALPGPFALRMSALAVCAGVALALGVHWLRKQGTADRTGPAPAPRSGGEGRAGQGVTVHQLSQQLREVVQQTESAALEINDRVISIIGRARTQLRTVTEVVNGLAREGNGGSGGQRDLPRMIEAMEAETASLSRDVNSVILSLQFQDLTKQRLEQVIRELHLLHDELELLRAHRGDGRTPAPRSLTPDAPGGRPEGPEEQGRSDGEDLSDRG
jgi:hypothetical protein